MSKPCTACGAPADDVIVIEGRRLPYHVECRIEAKRDMVAVRDALDRVTEHLLVDGALPRADEI